MLSWDRKALERGVPKGPSRPAESSRNIHSHYMSAHAVRVPYRRPLGTDLCLGGCRCICCARVLGGQQGHAVTPTASPSQAIAPQTLPRGVTSAGMWRAKWTCQMAISPKCHRQSPDTNLCRHVWGKVDMLDGCEHVLVRAVVPNHQYKVGRVVGLDQSLQDPVHSVALGHVLRGAQVNLSQRQHIMQDGGAYTEHC